MRKIVFTFLILIAVFKIFAQEIPAIEINRSFSKLPFNQMVTQIKELHRIEIYYKPEWVETVTLPEIEQPVLLDDFLTKLLSPFDLHHIVFQGNIVIMPGKLQVAESNEVAGSIFIIGNPLEKGKFKTAILGGTVLEGKTNLPIPGVQILCENLLKATSTNSEGKYQIELPVGNHRIKYSFMGLTDEEREIVIHGPGDLNVELYEKSISLDEINISAERPEDNFRSTSMGMVRLSMKSINKLSVLMGEPDIIKSMIMLPGVQSTGENASGFNVRGGNSDQNLVLIHDAPVFNTSHLFGFFSMLDPGLVSDVTLFKSGVPSRYGSRISSVMNVELRKGQTKKIKVNGGIGIINSRLSAEGPVNEKITFMVGARSTYSDWMLKLLNNYQLSQSSAYFYDFNAKLDYTINAKNRLSLFGYGSKDFFNYFGNAQYGYDNLIGSAKWSQIFNNNNSGALSINVSNYNANIVDFSHQNVEYNLNTGINQQQISYHFSSNSIARHKFNTGFSSVRYQIEPGQSTPYGETSIAIPIDMQDEQAFELGFYAEDEFDLTPELAVIAGVRYSAFLITGPDEVKQYRPDSPLNNETITGSHTIDAGKLSNYDHGLEPRLALRYEFRNNSSLKIGYNRTMQYIRQISNSASITPADYWKASDSYLHPLIANQYAIGYFKNINDNMYETSLELYYKDIQNEVDYKNGAQLVLNPNLEQVLIHGIGRAYGAEMLIKKSKGDLTGWLAYTYSRSFKQIDGTFAEEQINRGEWYKSNYDKPHDFTVVLNYKLSRRFTFSSNFTYSTGRPATYPEQKYSMGAYEIISFSDRNKYRLPDYHRLDMAFRYEGSLLKHQKWRSSWTISVYNVYGRNNTFSVFYEKQIPSHLNNYRNYALYRFSVIGVPVPSFTYNFWF